MKNDEKILKAIEQQGKTIESLHTRLDQQGKTIESMDKRLTGLEQGQERTNTALEAVRAGVEDVQAKQQEQPTKQDVETTVDAAKTELKAELASKADVQDLKASFMKEVKSQRRRINTLEDELDIPHPDKN